MSYDKVIRTEFLKKANSHELVLKELSTKFKETKDPIYVDMMYHDILDLGKLVYCNAGTYTIQAMDHIVHDLATDIITRFKTKPDYAVHAWYKYIRLVLLRFRDNYIRINSSQVYQPHHNDARTLWHRDDHTELTAEPWENISSLEARKLIDNSFAQSIERLAEFSRLDRNSSTYYRSMIRILHSIQSSPVHSRVILNSFRSIMKEVII